MDSPQQSDKPVQAPLNLPELPFDAWENGRMALHLMLQIIGKIRLKMMPRKNHWWYTTEYITARGISSHDMPYNRGKDLIEIVLNPILHRLELHTSQNESTFFNLSGISIAEFYSQLMEQLEKWGIHIEIVNKPFDLPIDNPFHEITDHVYQNEAYIERFWRIMIWVNDVFKEFSGRYYGKTCPVHLYWHHMDLTVTRFSGKKGPKVGKDWRTSDKDAYTHEVISFGFWAGDEAVREPAFYSYTYPAPKNQEKEPLQPEYAEWINSNGSPMAFMTYDKLRKSENPRQDLLDFMESSYQAGAKLAKWNIKANEVPPLEEL